MSTFPKLESTLRKNVISVELFGLEFTFSRSEFRAAIYEFMRTFDALTWSKLILRTGVICIAICKFIFAAFVTRGKVAKSSDLFTFQLREHKGSKTYGMRRRDGKVLFFKRILRNNEKVRGFFNEQAFFASSIPKDIRINVLQPTFYEFVHFVEIEYPRLEPKWELLEKSVVFSNLDFLIPFQNENRQQLRLPELHKGQAAILDKTDPFVKANRHTSKNWTFCSCHGDLTSNNLYTDKTTDEFLLVDFENFSSCAPHATDLVGLALGHLASQPSSLPSFSEVQVFANRLSAVLKMEPEIKADDVYLALKYLQNMNDRLATQVLKEYRYAA